MTDRTKDEAEASTTSPAKKTYRAPALVQWGTLRDITQSAGKNASAASDSGPSKGNKKTH